MRSLVVLALLLPLAGCAKKVAKSTGKADDTAPAAAPQPPAAKPVPVKKAEEKPSWLNDPRYQKGDRADAPSVGPPPGAPVAVTPPPGEKPPTPPRTEVPAKPAGKAVTRADMNDVWIFIENASLASGKMPGPDLVLAALLQTKSPAAELVRDGSIALSGARAREGIWAFEKDAPTRGGWIASQNGVEQVTASEFVRRATGR